MHCRLTACQPQLPTSWQPALERGREQGLGQGLGLVLELALALALPQVLAKAVVQGQGQAPCLELARPQLPSRTPAPLVPIEARASAPQVTGQRPLERGLGLALPAALWVPQKPCWRRGAPAADAAFR